MRTAGGKTQDTYRVYLTWDMGLAQNRMMAVASIIDGRKIDVLDRPVAMSPSTPYTTVSAT